MGWYTKDFTLNSDSTIATYEVNTNISSIQEINASAIQKTVISEKYGLITLYKPTSDILKQLTTKFMRVYESETVSTVIDLSKYILSFFSLPLDIETISSKNITLNGFDLEISSPYIDDNIITLDFGDIDIQGFYNNSIDYKYTNLSIYLPFINNQVLDVNKYMNKTINLSYKIDLFTGDILAILKHNDIVYDSFSGNCAIKIPYITNTSNSDISIKQYGNNNLLTDLKPKLIISSNVINENVKVSTNFYTQLDKLTGFNIVDYFEQPTNIHLLKVDYENIVNQLKQGVIF